MELTSIATGGTTLTFENNVSDAEGNSPVVIALDEDETITLDLVVVGSSNIRILNYPVKGGGSGTDDQTLSLGGTGNKSLTIEDGNTVALPVLANADQSVPTSGTRTITAGTGASLKLNDGSGRTWFEILSNSIAQSEGNGYLGENITFREHSGTDDDIINLNFDFDTGTDRTLVATPTDITYAGTSLLGGGSDSGQSLSPVTKSSGTSETYDNSDVTEGGTANAKRRWNKHATNDTIVLSSAITRYNQPWLESLNGADSLYIKKDTGTTLYIADSVAAVSGDGVILKGGRKAATIIAESANTFFVSGEVTVFSETVIDPIDTMTGLVASWREEDLPAVGNPSGNLTDRINSYVMVQKGSPTISAVTGGKQVLYDGVDDAHANDADNAAFDFVPQTDSFTYVIKTGTENGGFGEYPIFKGANGTNSQYSIEYRDGTTRIRLGSVSSNFSYNHVEASDDTIYVVSVSPTQVTLYVDGVP